MQGEQVEPDMSPLTRHEFATLVTQLQNMNLTKRIKEFTQKDNETERKLEVIQLQLNMLFKTTNDLGKDQNHQHARANNLEMKLRKRGGLSKEHAIDYVPYINLPDKHKRGGNRTTIANKYIVS